MVVNAEDHEPTRFLRTRILERAGFRVAEVSCAADALARAQDGSLLLLDVRLPDGDGFAVCEQVKRASPGYPVVMITSVYRTAQARRDAYAIGADAFLLEPVEPRELVRTIDALVYRRPAEADAPQPLWLITDATGEILDLSPESARLLNLTLRAARGRSLTAFFTENRPRLLADILRAAEGNIVDRVSMLQPRDRKAVRIRADISALPIVPGERVQVRWVLSLEPTA
jgi:DNA-binding response OmpR family regulator